MLFYLILFPIVFSVGPTGNNLNLIVPNEALNAVRQTIQGASPEKIWAADFINVEFQRIGNRLMENLLKVGEEVTVHRQVFKVLEEAGQGELGKTFKVQSLDGNIYALKQFTSNSESSIRNYKNEVAVLSRLKDLVAREDQKMMIVQKWIPGVSLENHMRTIQDTYQFHILRSHYLQALDDFHLNTGWLHGDVQPANILYDSSTGKMTWIDFGHTHLPPSEPNLKKEAFMQERSTALSRFDNDMRRTKKRPRTDIDLSQSEAKRILF